MKRDKTYPSLTVYKSVYHPLFRVTCEYKPFVVNYKLFAVNIFCFLTETSLVGSPLFTITIRRLRSKKVNKISET